MWQRFTERSRRVIFYSQEEAGRFADNFVSTEHLLLGLIREDDSVAAHILEALHVELDRIRLEVERQIVRGEGQTGRDKQLTPRAKRAIDLSFDEAKQLDNDYIGTEHLLLGLIREGESIAAGLLVRLGVTQERARQEVRVLQERIIAPKRNPVEQIAEANVQFSSLVKAAANEARAMSKPVAREHLLLAILTDESSVSSKALAQLHLTAEHVREAIKRVYESQAKPGTQQKAA
jgi:ATP-dependent Clp protease ATP-binding subunit ClpA